MGATDRFRALFEGSPATMLLIDPDDGRIIDANPAAAAYYGWSRDELRRLVLRQLVAESDELIEREVALARAGDVHRLEVRHRLADGSIHDVEVHTSPVEVDGQVQLFSIIVDIDERRRAERALEHSSELMRHVIEHDPAATALFDRDLRYIFVSERFLDDYGVTERDVIGRHHYDVFPEIPEEWREVHRRTLAGEVLRSEESRFERVGGRVDWVRWECRPWYDQHGEIGGMGLYSEVITAQKQLEERLLHAQKMELIGQLAGGIAHDFRNALQIVLSHTELALDEAEDDDPLVEYLDGIRDATERTVGLTQQLMTLAQRQSIDPLQIDTVAAVDDSLGLLQRLLGRSMGVEHVHPDRPCPVLVDPTQFHQVLVNLWLNARDAVVAAGRERGLIRIETRPETVDAADPRYGPGAIDGEFVVVEVTDDGIGMDAETLSHLFEPFFSTKSTGTGLGLATVYGIVARHGGFLHVTSEPGVGSTFRTYWPAVRPG